ncbi:MAG: SHD1 domain-containing protein [Planctomycetota bacterium]
MLDRLENDRSLARFAGQFVPLKIITSNNPEWAKWSRLYPIEGGGIPRLYVIRADGEKLFAGIGSLPGDKLPLMMTATLRQAGRSFNDADAVFLEQLVEKSQASLADEKLLEAAITLSAMTKIGSPDKLGSYAKPAIEAAELYEQLVARLEQNAEAAESSLDETSDATDPLESLITLYEVENALKLFPSLKAKAGELGRTLNQLSSLGESTTQAESLVKARVFAAQSNPRFQSRAASAYTSVIRRFPGTRVDELAREELATIKPDAKILATDPESLASMPELRQWSARVGDFSIKARYLQQRDGKVQLQKEDGAKIVVDIAALSDSDQTYLKSQRED